MNKNICLTLYGADQKKWRSGDFELMIRDPRDDLAELPFWVGDESQSTTRLKSSKCDLQLAVDLAFDRGQRYYLRVEANDHHADDRRLKRTSFIKDEIEQEKLSLSMILVPEKVQKSDSSNLNDGFKHLQKSGSPLVQNGSLSNKKFRALDPNGEKNHVKQMALLNLEAKLRATMIGNDSLIASVTGLDQRFGRVAVKPDRIYVMMKKEIKDKVSKSDDFDRVLLGHENHPDSWKQRGLRRGSLQLSFSKDLIDGKDVYSVDVDIDLHRDLIDHLVAEVAPNFFTGGKTNQRIVYRLLHEQEICPVYTLNQTG